MSDKILEDQYNFTIKAESDKRNVIEICVYMYMTKLEQLPGIVGISCLYVSFVSIFSCRCFKWDYRFRDWMYIFGLYNVERAPNFRFLLFYVYGIWNQHWSYWVGKLGVRVHLRFSFYFLAYAAFNFNGDVALKRFGLNFIKLFRAHWYVTLIDYHSLILKQNTINYSSKQEHKNSKDRQDK